MVVCSVLPDTTAISSSSWPGVVQLMVPADTRRVDEAVVPTVLWDSLRPRSESTSRLAVDISLVQRLADTGGSRQRVAEPVIKMHVVMTGFDGTGLAYDYAVENILILTHWDIQYRWKVSRHQTMWRSARW